MVKKILIVLTCLLLFNVNLVNGQIKLLGDFMIDSVENVDSLNGILIRNSMLTEFLTQKVALPNEGMELVHLVLEKLDCSKIKINDELGITNKSEHIYYTFYKVRMDSSMLKNITRESTCKYNWVVESMLTSMFYKSEFICAIQYSYGTYSLYRIDGFEIVEKDLLEKCITLEYESEIDNNKRLRKSMRKNKLIDVLLH